MDKRFDISEYSKDENRPPPIRKNKKVIGLMKDKLGGKIMIELVVLKAKMYAYRKIDKELEAQKSVLFLKALRLKTIRPACLMVKRYRESKCCLRIRSLRYTQLIRIIEP